MPTELGNMISMDYFSILTTRIEGAIPTELGRSNTEDFAVKSNSLDSNIPTQVQRAIPTRHLNETRRPTETAPAPSNALSLSLSLCLSPPPL